MTDPRIERALEEFFEAERLSRRRFLGRAGSAGLALTGLSTLLAACGGVEGTAEKSAEENAEQAAAVSHPKTDDRRLDVLQLAALHRQEGPQGLRQGVRRQGQVRRGHQRQLRVLREGPPAAAERAADRPRHRDADRLHGRRAGSATATSSRSTRRTSRTSSNLVDNLETINYDPKREFTLPWQSGAIGIGYNIKKTGRELKNVNDLFDPKFKGRVTMLSEPYDSASTVLLGDGIDRVEGQDRPDPRGDREDRQGEQKGQFRRFTGNDYTTDLAKGNIWVALAYSGDLVQLQSDNPDLRFAYSEEGALPSPTT